MPLHALLSLPLVLRQSRIQHRLNLHRMPLEPRNAIRPRILEPSHLLQSALLLLEQLLEVLRIELV